VSEDTILILADQPWQLELAARFSQYLRNQDPGLRVELAATDYFTFLYEKDLLKKLEVQYDLRIHHLEDLYRSWQTKSEPNLEATEHELVNWANFRTLSRPVDSLAKTNQLIFGWEREYFYLPISRAWERKVLLDSILWSENLIKDVKPSLVISIERNTLCNNLVYEISKNEKIEHICFILSRFGNKWIPHSEFGLGFPHPLSRDTKFSNGVFPRVFLNGSQDFRESRKTTEKSLYKALAINLQDIMSQKFSSRFVYVLGKDLGNGVSNSRRLVKQIFSRLRNPRSSYPFQISRLEQDFVKLTFWELKQILLYNLRLLGIKKWGRSEPIDGKFIFWALHSRPEDSTSVLGFGQDEVEVISSAAQDLPHDVMLLVKEHPIMFGTRSNDFYRKLRRIPGVILVDAFSDSQRFIRNVCCIGVAGISGTVLLESEIQGKLAFAFGSPEFAPYLSSHQLTFREYLRMILSKESHNSGGKINSYANFIDTFSSNVDVPYLCNMDDSRVGVMLNHWSNIIFERWSR